MVKTRKCEVLVINQIAQVGLKRFPGERYAVVKESKDPWAIVVRSQDLHKFEFGPSLRAVGRAVHVRRAHQDRVGLGDVVADRVGAVRQARQAVARDVVERLDLEHVSRAASRNRS